MSRSIVRLMLVILGLAQLTMAQSELAKTKTQPPASESEDATIRELERQVEAAIVSGDTEFLGSVYADDFRYARTTGQIDNKTQWLETVARHPFVSRRIVALDVEIHGSVAVTYGQLDMTVRNEQGEHNNLLQYLRVYEKRNGHWQMLTHRSLEETTTVKTAG